MVCIALLLLGALACFINKILKHWYELKSKSWTASHYRSCFLLLAETQAVALYTAVHDTSHPTNLQAVCFCLMPSFTGVACSCTNVQMSNYSAVVLQPLPKPRPSKCLPPSSPILVGILLHADILIKTFSVWSKLYNFDLVIKLRKLRSISCKI